MKTTKKTTKSTKATKVTKTAKAKCPELVVNLTDVITTDDLKYEIVTAKVRAGIAVTEDELADFESVVIKDTMDMCNVLERLADVVKYAADVFIGANEPKQKLPWYKRLWKKLFGKKN